jgi:hypothetical protein
MYRPAIVLEEVGAGQTQLVRVLQVIQAIHTSDYDDTRYRRLLGRKNKRSVEC